MALLEERRDVGGEGRAARGAGLVAKGEAGRQADGIARKDHRHARSGTWRRRRAPARTPTPGYAADHEARTKRMSHSPSRASAGPTRRRARNADRDDARRRLLRPARNKSEKGAGDPGRISSFLSACGRVSLGRSARGSSVFALSEHGTPAGDRRLVLRRAEADAAPARPGGRAVRERPETPRLLLNSASSRFPPGSPTPAAWSGST